MALIRRRTLFLFAVFLVVYAPVSQGRLFIITNSETSKPCLLADVDFTLDLAAVRGEETVAGAQVSSDDESIQVGGNCGNYVAVLNLIFPYGVTWALTFTQNDYQQAFMNTYVQFIPAKIFGEAVPVQDYQTMKDPVSTDIGNATESYLCPVPESVQYEDSTVTTTKTNFTAQANISYLHVQAFDVFEGNFSTSHLCEGALTTTRPSPAVNTTLTTEPTHEPENTTASHNATTEPTHEPENTTASHNATTEPTPPMTTKKPSPTPTSSPKPPLKLYTVTDGDEICIAMEAALTLDITYPVEGKGKTKTAKIFVPKDSVGSGNCSLSASSQDLVISFFNDWKLSFTFSRTKKASFLESVLSNSNEEKEKHPTYKISQVQLTGSADKKMFPDTTWPAGTKLKFTSDNLNFPTMGPSKAYYKCSSSLQTKLGANADVKSEELKVKAFNNNNKADFSGQAAVCAADSGSSRKKTYIIVGCVLGAIVLLAFIVFVVMRVIRKRRENYHSLQ